MRRLSFCFLFVIVFLLTFHPCEAAIISPDLQAVVQTAPSYQEVPVIVNLADKVDVKQIPLVPTNHTKAGRTIRRSAIVKALKDKADKTQGPIKTLLQSRGGKKMKPLWITNSIAVTVPASTINELAGSPQIASIELDAVIPAMPIISAPAGTPRWNIDRVNAPALWAAGITGSSSVVANFDTGVDVKHPDLKYRWRGGACSAPPDCPSWFDPYGNTTLPFGIPATGETFTELDSIHGHGTNTMGVMVGGSASGNSIGVAPGATWIAAKIFDDSGNATTSVILSAFQWALAPAGDAANAPDIANNSWTISDQNTCDTSLLTAISNLTAVDIEVVFAAGNVGTTPAPLSSSFSPANNAGVFAVGATDCIGSGCASPSNIIAPYSAWGPSACDGTTPGQSPARTTNFPNIVAPGSIIYSSVPTGGNFTNYSPILSGTSMAAPHVAGAAALLAGAMLPTILTPAQIEEALQQSALPLPLVSSPPNNTYGYGLLDVAAAYQYAFTEFIGGGTPQPKIAGLDSSLFFINTSTSADLTFVVVNQGTAALTISDIAIAGLNPGDFAIKSGTDTCSGVLIPSLGSCSVTITFSPGVAGSRSAQLSFTSNDPSILTTFDVPLHGNDPVALARVQDDQSLAVVATYPDIQTALNNSDSWNNWDIIKIQAGGPFAISSDINLPLGITISLLGGYDAAFSSQADFTTIQGPLTISGGSVIAGNIIVQ